MTSTNTAKAGVWSHLHKLVKNTLRPPRKPKGLGTFAGKTIVIVCPTSEIGLQAAIEFTRLGAARVILGVRGIQRGSVATDRIRCATLYRHEDDVLVLELDLSSFPSVEDFVNNVQKSTSKVHAVILIPCPHNEEVNREEVRNEDDEIIRSPHGSEMHLQVNVISTAYLAIFLLALLLETSIEEKSPTHLEFACSGRYDYQEFKSFLTPGLSILKHLNSYTCPSVQFPTTSFLEMAVMSKLADCVKPSKVIVFAACPGSCGKRATLHKRLFARMCEQGSRTLVTGVLHGPRVHGKLWQNDTVRE